MGEVVPLNVVTMLPVPPECILECALKAGLSEVIIVGLVKETGKLYFAASETSAAKIGFELDLAKATLVQNQLAKI